MSMKFSGGIKLGGWGAGELGSWGAGELGSWGAGELGRGIKRFYPIFSKCNLNACELETEWNKKTALPLN